MTIREIMALYVERDNPKIQRAVLMVILGEISTQLGVDIHADTQFTLKDMEN